MSSAVTTGFVVANGLRFAVDRCGAGRALALFLHGFPESKHSWRFQLPVLADLGFTCWAPDLRGYGGSSRPTGKAAYRLEHLLDDVAGLIDAARAEGIDGPVTLVGHDWGGIVAWSFAMAAQRPIYRLVVMNFPHPRLFLDGIRHRKQLLRSWYMFVFQLPWLPEWVLRRDNAQAVADAFLREALDHNNFGPEVLDHYRDNALRPGALTAMLNYYRANLANRRAHRLWRTAGRLSTPTLLLWGERDAELCQELTYGTDALVDDVTVRYLPDVSHWVQQEAPDMVNAMVSAWLQGRDVPHPYQL